MEGILAFSGVVQFIELRFYFLILSGAGTPHMSSGRTTEIAPAAPAPLAKSKPAYCVRTSNRGSPINKPSIEMNGSKQPEFIVPRYQRF